MDKIIIDQRWGFLGLFAAIVPLVINAFTAKEKRDRLINVIGVIGIIVVCVLVFKPNLVNAVLYGFIGLIISSSILLIKEKLPTVFEIVTAVPLLILSILGLISIIQARTTPSYNNLDWPLRLIAIVAALLLIIIIPLLFLGIMRISKGNLLINNFEMIYKKYIINILAICGIFFIRRISIDQLSDYFNTVYSHNLFILTTIFIEDIFSILLTYFVWFKKLNFILKVIYYIIGTFGIIYAVINPLTFISIPNNNENMIYTIIGYIIIFLLLIYYILIVFLQEKRKPWYFFL